MSLLSIPIDIQNEIIASLPYQDIIHLCQTNSSLMHRCRDDNFWRYLFQQRYPEIPIPSGHNHQSYFRTLELKTNIFVMNSKERICQISTTSKEVVLAAISAFAMSVADLSDVQLKATKLAIFLPGLKRLSKKVFEEYSKIARKYQTEPPKKDFTVFVNSVGHYWVTTLTNPEVETTVKTIAEFLDHPIIGVEKKPGLLL